MRKARRFIAAATVVLMAVNAAGCFRGPIGVPSGTSETNDDNAVKKAFTNSSGDTEKTITVAEGETMTVSFSVAPVTGNIDITLTDADGESFYEGNDVPVSDFIVELSEAGDYTLTVDTDDDSTGSFDISWEAAEKEEE